MNQPTAEKALREMEPLIGEWALRGDPPGWPALAWAGAGFDRVA
jgi:hypothetical protein